jgi:hypothetical protein
LYAVDVVEECAGISWRSTTKVFGEKEEIEYDKNRDNRDGSTTGGNKGSDIGKEKGILSS